MEFKGTKAPWIDQSIELSDWRSLSIGNLELNRMVAHCYIIGNNISDEEKANAKLISKSPEMLDMLKEMVKELEFHGFHSSKTTNEARELIKEATCS